MFTSWKDSPLIYFWELLSNFGAIVGSRKQVLATIASKWKPGWWFLYILSRQIWRGQPKSSKMVAHLKMSFGVLQRMSQSSSWEQMERFMEKLLNWPNMSLKRKGLPRWVSCVDQVCSNSDSFKLTVLSVRIKNFNLNLLILCKGLHSNASLRVRSDSYVLLCMGMVMDGCILRLAGIHGCAVPWPCCTGGSRPRFWRWYPIPECNPSLPTVEGDQGARWRVIVIGCDSHEYQLDNIWGRVRNLNHEESSWGGLMIIL